MDKNSKVPKKPAAGKPKSKSKAGSKSPGGKKPPKRQPQVEGENEKNFIFNISDNILELQPSQQLVETEIQSLATSNEKIVAVSYPSIPAKDSKSKQSMRDSTSNKDISNVLARTSELKKPTEPKSALIKTMTSGLKKQDTERKGKTEESKYEIISGYPTPKEVQTLDKPRPSLNLPRIANIFQLARLKPPEERNHEFMVPKAQSKFTISSLNEMINSLAHKSKSEVDTGPKTERQSRLERQPSRQSQGESKTARPMHSIPTVSSGKPPATQTLTLRSEKSAQAIILDVHKRGIFEHSTNETAEGVRLPTVNINSKVQTLQSRPPAFDDKLIKLAHKIEVSKKTIKTTRLLNQKKSLHGGEESLKKLKRNHSTGEVLNKDLGGEEKTAEDLIMAKAKERYENEQLMSARVQLAKSVSKMKYIKDLNIEYLKQRAGTDMDKPVPAKLPLWGENAQSLFKVVKPKRTKPLEKFKKKESEDSELQQPALLPARRSVEARRPKEVFLEQIDEQEATERLEHETDLFDQLLKRQSMDSAVAHTEQTPSPGLRLKTKPTKGEIKTQATWHLDQTGIKAYMRESSMQRSSFVQRPSEKGKKIDSKTAGIIVEILKEKLNVFSKPTQNLFKYGILGGKGGEQIRKSLNVQQNSFHKSKLKDQYLMLAEAIINSQHLAPSHADPSLNDEQTELITSMVDLHKEQVEQLILPELIDYSKMYLKLWQKQSSTFLTRVEEGTTKLQATEEDPSSQQPSGNGFLPNGLLDFSFIRSKIGVAEFDTLFSREGFAKDFLKEYNACFSQLMDILKDHQTQAQAAFDASATRSQKERVLLEQHTSQLYSMGATTNHVFYFMQNLLALRLQCLFQYEDVIKQKEVEEAADAERRSMEAQKRALEFKVKMLEEKIAGIVSENSAHTQLMNSVKKDRDKFLEEVVSQNKIITKQQQQIQFLNSELNHANNLKEQRKFMRRRSHDLYDSKVLTYNNLEFKDLPTGTEKISNLAIQLEVFMREIKDMRKRRTNIQEQIEEIVEHGVESKKVDNEKAQYQIFEKLIKAVDQSRKKYIIKQDYDLIKDKCQIQVCKGTQTDFSPHVLLNSIDSSRTTPLDLNLFNNEAAFSQTKEEPKEKQIGQIDEQESSSVTSRSSALSDGRWQEVSIKPEELEDLDAQEMVAKERERERKSMEKAIQNTVVEHQGIMLMSKDNLFKVMDDLLFALLDVVLAQQEAFKGKQFYLESQGGMLDTKLGLSFTKVDAASLSDSIIEFGYNYFLKAFGLKSKAIKQLKSLAIGLKKFFLQDEKANMFAMFMIKLFGFRFTRQFDSLESNDNLPMLSIQDQQSREGSKHSKKSYKSHSPKKLGAVHRKNKPPPSRETTQRQQQDREAKTRQPSPTPPEPQSRQMSREQQLRSREQQQREEKLKLQKIINPTALTLEEHVNSDHHLDSEMENYSNFKQTETWIVIWSRRVFTYAQGQYIKLHPLIKRQGAAAVEARIKRNFKYYLLQNGGQLGLNFVFQILRKALLGIEVNQRNETVAPATPNLFKPTPLERKISTFQAKSKIQTVASLSKATNLKLAENRQILIDFIFNLRLTDVTVHNLLSSTSVSSNAGETEKPGSRDRTSRAGSPSRQQQLRMKKKREEDDVPLTKMVCDFNKNYQLFTEARFLLWKLLAVIDFSEINLQNLSFKAQVQSTPATEANVVIPSADQKRRHDVETMSFNKKDEESSSEDGRKIPTSLEAATQAEYKRTGQKPTAIDEKCIDLQILINFINRNYCTQPPLALLKKRAEVEKKKAKRLRKEIEIYEKILGQRFQFKASLFDRRETIILFKYLSFIGIQDIRAVKMSMLKYLIASNVHLEKQTVDPPPGLKQHSNFASNVTEGRFERLIEDKSKLFAISSLQFAQVCVRQWKFCLEQQISDILKIFSEADLNNDGVLTLEEFWLLMEKLEGKTQAKLATPSVGMLESVANTGLTERDRRMTMRNTIPSSHEQKKSFQGMSRHRAIMLFNEALDLSIPAQQEAILKIKNQQQQKLEGLDKVTPEEEEAMDKISPMAFTQMILKNRIGGFSAGNMFSDLRFTLRMQNTQDGV